MSIEEQLRLITDRLPVFVAYIDRNHTYQFVNEYYQEFFGVNTADLIGKTAFQTLDESTGRAILDAQSRALAGEVVHFETVIRNFADDPRQVEIDYLPDVDRASMTVRGYVAIGRDVTEQKLVGQALLRAREAIDVARLEMYELFMQMPIGVAVVEGPEHTFVLMNPTFQNVLFGEHRYLLGTTVATALPELAEQREYLDGLNRVYHTGQTFVGKEQLLTVVQGDGTRRSFYLDVICHPKHDTLGDIDGLILLFHDVTATVDARLRLEQAVRSRDAFLSIASHELKTPLTSLLLSAQGMQRFLEHDPDATVPRSRVEKLVKQTDKGVQRLNRLVDDMLDSSRIALDKLTLNHERTDLCELTAELIERLQPQVSAAGGKLTLERGPPLFGMWDPFRIEQVLTNLLTNALRYGSPDITVQVRPSGDFAAVAVSDHGPGIAPADQERIFQRFERLQRPDGISGFGLGLFISREIATRHGGTLEVQSTPGNGATFTLRLPLPTP